VDSMPTAEPAILLELKLLGRALLVLRRGVIALLTLCASEGNNVTH
jgi:hypothetical protein